MLCGDSKNYNTYLMFLIGALISSQKFTCGKKQSLIRLNTLQESV